MFGSSSKGCELNCQCSGLITDSFQINCGSATKRRSEAVRMQHPKLSPQNSIVKRRILGEIQNTVSLPNSPKLQSSPKLQLHNSPKLQLHNSPRLQTLRTPLKSPLIRQSPLHSGRSIRHSSKISRIFEERSMFKMNKENEPSISETFLKLQVEEETSDSGLGDRYECYRSKTTVTNWSMTKLDFKDTLPPRPLDTNADAQEFFVPEKEMETNDPDLETLHDLEEEFEADNFDQCTKYEIISTDSPDIISRGRSSSRKITARNLEFGAPLLETETSTSFNQVPSTNRMLNFEESFEFTSPAAKKSSLSVKKSLKFNETPKKLVRDSSESSIGTMSSPASSRMCLYPSESTTSMESGFMSEAEEQFDLEEVSSSPKVANFNDLLSGQINDNFLKRPNLNRSISLHQPIAKVSLFSIAESPRNKSQKRPESSDELGPNKRRKASSGQILGKEKRPVLQRAFSENNASIMSALARSVIDPDLIGDFSSQFALPLTIGDHSDLKSISCDTLAALLNGDFQDTIKDYQVIDCRYPYEYDGGHILGAVNLYTTSHILELVNQPLPSTGDRSILVFHCEFSLERGPKLSRFLRSSDRAANKESYPSLHYPEVYLLHEGYRKFFQLYPAMCTPVGYTAMLDPQHKAELRQHRSVQQPSASNPHHTHRRQRLLL